jgi:hypothetical protein
MPQVSHPIAMRSKGAQSSLRTDSRGQYGWLKSTTLNPPGTLLAGGRQEPVRELRTNVIPAQTVAIDSSPLFAASVRMKKTHPKTPFSDSRLVLAE